MLDLKDHFIQALKAQPKFSEAHLQLALLYQDEGDDKNTITHFNSAISADLEEAEKLTNEFIRTRAGIINDSLDIVDTRDFHFSLKTLKQYIEYVEQEGKKLGREDLGIRIHFAAYPERSEYPDPGFSTVVLVPTASVQGQVKPQGILPVQEQHEVIDSLKALNFGNGGRPPNDLE